MPLAKSYTRTRGGDIRHRKEGHKEDQAGRQANSPTTKFVTSVTLDLA
jgi:hypothetical protein